MSSSSTLAGVPEAFRRSGGKLSIGYVGAFPRMLAELLAQETRTELLRVPYKGLPAAMQDLMGDQTDMIVGDAIGVLVEQINAGNVVPLAVTSARRMLNLPQVPTTAELEVKLAFARQAGDEAKHYRLIETRLGELGVDTSNLDPLAKGRSPLLAWLLELEGTVARVAAASPWRIALIASFNCFW